VTLILVDPVIEMPYSTFVKVLYVMVAAVASVKEMLVIELMNLHCVISMVPSNPFMASICPEN
jgi:hypothetical protein